MSLEYTAKNVAYIVVIVSALAAVGTFVDVRYVHASDYTGHRVERIEDKIAELEGDIEVLETLDVLTHRERLELAKLKNLRLKFLRKLGRDE